ncbi:MAG: hypothetical protein OHK0018_01620 [Erythrobacter tepidarius]
MVLAIAEAGEQHLIIARLSSGGCEARTCGKYKPWIDRDIAQSVTTRRDGLPTDGGQAGMDEADAIDAGRRIKAVQPKPASDQSRCRLPEC